ncbi:SOSS complex subunit B homolog [Topomyia yanbarensis]|uniref:SOSS complex subunit B homolog n=1 Tax=Topomyia yanbarensis TaxID=2498891 RepID=UPI00273AE2B7|nr:SOSS complex subunit B homolog [Topomyia yanbarensis]XP_058834846.1 SOSS complex subunit B homolog [Topomyia yanbarensis]
MTSSSYSSAHPIDIIAIKDIYPGLKNVNVIFIVLEIGPVTLTKENREVRTFKVADQSAAINVSIWDEPGKLLMPGDIVRLTKGYAAVWRQCLTLYSGKNGEIHRLGDFCFTFNEMINMSEPNPNLITSNQPLHGNGAAGGGNAAGKSNRQQSAQSESSPGPSQMPASGSTAAKTSQQGGRYSAAGSEQSKSSPKNTPRTGRSGQAKGAAAKSERR